MLYAVSGATEAQARFVSRNTGTILINCGHGQRAEAKDISNMRITDTARTSGT